MVKDLFYSKKLILFVFFILFPITGNFGAASFHQLASKQMSILIITVDQLSITKPTIRSIWLGLMLPSRSSISLIPIYSPSLGVITFNKDIDSLSPNAKVLHPALIDSLNENGIYWDNYIILDDKGWANIMEPINGPNQQLIVSNKNKSIAGQSPGFFSTTQNQKIMFQKICFNLSVSSKTNMMSLFYSSNNVHLKTDLSMGQIVDIQAVYQDKNQVFTCKFPTLEN